MTGAAEGMRLHRWVWLVALAALGALPFAGTAQAACIDLSKGAPLQLEGLLAYHIFPGPPDYEDVSAGDEPAHVYILHLREALCAQGDNLIDPSTRISQVHLVSSEETRSPMRSLIGADVVVTLVDPYGAHTAHHRAPLVGTVSAIAGR